MGAQAFAQAHLKKKTVMRPRVFSKIIFIGFPIALTAIPSKRNTSPHPKCSNGHNGRTHYGWNMYEIGAFISKTNLFTYSFGASERTSAA